MPIVFPIEVPFIVLVAGVGAWMLMRTETMWLRPALQGLQHPTGAWWKRLALKAAGAVVAATLFVEKQVRLALSHFADGGLHLLARVFNGAASMFHFLFREVGAIADDIADALSYLRHHTIPHLIGRAVAPVRHLAHAAMAEALAAERFAKAQAERLARGIDRLGHRLEHLVIPRITALERSVAGVISHDLPRLRRGEIALEHELGDLAGRLKRIEKALGLGIFAALVYKILARVAPWLFCRNVNKLGRAVCGMNPSALDALIAALLAEIALQDIRTLARYAAAVEREVADDVVKLVG